MKKYRLIHELPCGETVEIYMGTKAQMERIANRIRDNLGRQDEGVMYTLRIKEN